MAVSKTLIKSRAADDNEPASILTHVNNELSQDNQSSMFVTVFLGVINIKTGVLEYTNAGHNPPYIKRRDGTVEKVGAFHGPVIGAMPGMPYKQDSTRFSKGDIILVYTDGVTETFNEEDQLFSEERLADLLLGDGLDSTEQIIKTTLSNVKQFQGEAEQADDVTILAVQYIGLMEEGEYDQLKITIKNRLDDVGVVEEQFYEFAQESGIPDTIRQKVSIVLDEMLNNIVSYAYQDDGEHDIEVDIDLSGNRLVVTIKDEGVPFNPFGLGEPDVGAGMDERQIGGLGIHLVRSTMDEYLYQRHINKNVVTLVKFIDK
jgi:sigma-B regulation protein RsbU (phosphoserine phosphatase)